MTTDIKENLVKHFKTSQSIPFLFIGSGFSRRYINLESWEDLLRRFCRDIKPFEYYYSTANKSLPKVASLMAIDFHENWWNSGEYKGYIETFKDSLNNDAAALKISIASYLNSISKTELRDENYAEELEILPKLTIDGIITTNWDLFLENIFPDYEKYIGQEELLFSNPQSIGEIYKIHGCCSNPNSMVLTDEDYRNFKDRNTYLAAKLITIFVEHPVIFIGYSLRDETINSLLMAIVNCLKPNDLDKIRNNLIFVQKGKPGLKEGILDTFLYFESAQIPVKVITTNSFLPVYEALTEIKRKIPVKMLRNCKKQLYELIRDNDPIGKISVVDIDDIVDKKDIEFVIGIGVSRDIISKDTISRDTISKDTISTNTVSTDIVSDEGYSGLSDYKLYSYFLDIDKDYNSGSLLKRTLLEKYSRTKYYPVFKFLQEQRINNENDYISSEFKCDKIDKFKKVTAEMCKTRSSTPLHQFDNSVIKKRKFDKIVTEYPIKKVLEFIPLMDINLLEKEKLFEFLRENISLSEDDSTKSLYRKLICYTDRVFYSWD